MCEAGVTCSAGAMPDSSSSQRSAICAAATPGASAENAASNRGSTRQSAPSCTGRDTEHWFKQTSVVYQNNLNYLTLSEIKTSIRLGSLLAGELGSAPGLPGQLMSSLGRQSDTLHMSGVSAVAVAAQLKRASRLGPVVCKQS